MNLQYRHTLYASYLGYITQAIINNLPPLLFLTFQNTFSISLEQIGLLISINFGVQMIVDFLSAKFVDKIGYRICIVSAHIMCTIGLIGLGVFPFLFDNAYIGLILAIIINGIGGGLIEVLVSPIVEAIPGDEKASAMSLLHSFYCWGHVAVVILSTIYFSSIGINNWRYISMIWAFIPFINIFLFLVAPINKLENQQQELSIKKLFSIKLFWLFIILMICSGASEQAMSQWASLFAESGLKVSKTMGDLLGPCAFAILMGLSRVFYGNFGSKINLKKFIKLSSVLCIISYLITVFSPIPILSLIGCAMCGFSVGIMWPGTFSLSTKYCPSSTAMFALLALAGDIGCSVGPSIVGFISNTVINKLNNLISFNGFTIVEIGLRIGLFFSIIFPITMFILIHILNKKTRY